MKDFLILATITIIIGVFIPSKEALAILAVVTSIVLVIAGKLGARGLQRVQEVPNENPNRKPDGGCYTSMRELRERDARLYGRHSNNTHRNHN